VTMFESRGCDTCSEGFHGRVGVFQLMLMNDELAELTTQRPSRETLARAAAAAGMRSLREDGLDKVARGLTTLDELSRALPA
jgi:type IV pilus assembly protein PilB